MTRIDLLLKTLKAPYDNGQNPVALIGTLAAYCLKKLQSKATTRRLADVGEKEYWLFESNGRMSRPYLRERLVTSTSGFSRKWTLFKKSFDSQEKRIDLDGNQVNDLLYTAITTFSVCYDLWKPKSRKTPGTFFEVIMGSVLGKLLPDYSRDKHVLIPKQPENVSTDIVFSLPDKPGGLVIPVKITTRERIVQPFAHQRILDSVFGEQTYRSILVCMSEMQRDGDSNAKEICVPGTIRLFQLHLARLKRIYYLDPPWRYLQKDVSSVLSVRTVGDLLTTDLSELL